MIKALVPLKPGSALKRAQTQSIVEMWLRGRAPDTVRAYKADLEHFGAFVGLGARGTKKRPGTPGLADKAASFLVTREPGEANAVVLEYQKAQLEAGLSAATINRRIAALISVVKLARQLGQIIWELEVDQLEARAYRDTLGPPIEDVRKVFDALKGTRNETRDRVILTLMFDLALRRGEVAGLNLEHVDLTKGRARLSILGKKRRDREWVTLSTDAAVTMAAWIVERGNEPGSLFGVKYRTLYRIVAFAGKHADVKLWPHALRHSGATTGLDVTGGDVRKVAKFTRHRDIKTLMIYDDNRHDHAGDVSELIAKRRRGET